MSEQLVIQAENELLPSEDYQFLRREGIRLIEQLAGKVWTDYNTHDPGITILEALCYALTDLGYRTSFDLKDILACGSGDSDNRDIFYTARQILSSAPVTITDFRKLIIDTDGVKNAWIEISKDYEIPLYLTTSPSDGGGTVAEIGYDTINNHRSIGLRGLYRVLVEYEEKVKQKGGEQQVYERIRSKLQDHRNLCEDFISISSVEYEYFTMEADVQVHEGTNIEKINAQIFHLVQRFFSPSIKFYTLAQMQERGYTTEEIFEGPALKHGFIDTAELEQSDRCPHIHLSDIVNDILKIEGVIAVRKCLFPAGSQTAFSDFTEWIKKETVSAEKVLRLDIDNSIIRFSRSGDRHRQANTAGSNKERVKAIYSFLQSESGTTRLNNPVMDLTPSKGEDMSLNDYYPFQFNLPSSYGLGEEIIKSAQAKNEYDLSRTIEDHTRKEDDDGLNRKIETVNSLNIRQKQILQLKGYLMVFEQVMADYLEQLANLHNLFSYNSSIKQTYFSHDLKWIPDTAFLHAREKEANSNEKEKDFLDRRNKILDHLLARFGEEMSKFSLYAKNVGSETELLKAKSAMLADYLSVSNYRGCGYNYRDANGIWNTNNVAGAKKRIFRLLGIKDHTTRHSTCNWIGIERVENSDKSLRYVAVVRDPENNGNALLESNLYETESEASYVLNLILQHGYHKKSYEIDTKSGKYRYVLQMENKEGILETVGQKAANSKENLENYFSSLITSLQSFTAQENLHMVEHILLRPKIDPFQNPKDAEAMQSDAVQTLSLINVPAELLSDPKLVEVSPYKFKILRLKQNDQLFWKLGLIKNDKTDTLTVNESFPLRKNASDRMIRIRQVGADRTNYKTNRNADGYFGFSLAEGERLLATGKYYRKQEEMDAEINELVSFFSFELNSLKQAQEHDDFDEVDNIDPYSLQVSFFIPGWPARFREPTFRYLLEKSIVLELPAHIRSHIYWLDYQEMKEFEMVYKPWLEEMANHEIPDTLVVNNLVSIINKIRKKN